MIFARSSDVSDYSKVLISRKYNENPKYEGHYCGLITEFILTGCIFFWCREEKKDYQT